MQLLAVFSDVHVVLFIFNLLSKILKMFLFFLFLFLFFCEHNSSSDCDFYTVSSVMGGWIDVWIVFKLF